MRTRKGEPLSVIAAWLIMGTIVVIQGCSLVPPRTPVPIDRMNQATPLPGVIAVRAWSGTPSEPFAEDLLASVRQDSTETGDNGPFSLPPINMLTLSGGSDDGAFGAGFLVGWSHSGLRPSFKIVTGISAGALIAPFAFLGEAYDAQLEEAFTQVGPKDIYRIRGLSALWSASLADSAPLKQLIENYFNEQVLHAIAKAHREGRRLYIGTTNLDADRLVIWNIGAIANSGQPGAMELVQQIILASSSIPVAFPPVLIKVELDGRWYDEMHVDGGVKAQLFFTAATIDMAKIRKQIRSDVKKQPVSRLYVIRNAKTGPEPKPTERRLDEISRRSMNALIKSQARSDLARVYRIAKAEDIDFNWIAIPSAYESPDAPPFSRCKMNQLFKIGYESGLQEQPWRKTPPDFDQR